MKKTFGWAAVLLCGLVFAPSASATTIGTDIGVSGNLTVVGNSTTTNATTTSLNVSSAFSGAGLSTCNGGSNALTWNGGQFGCNTIVGGGGSSNWATSSEGYYWSQFLPWTFANGYLAPSTTVGMIMSASSTIAKLNSTNSTSTNATSTNLFAATAIATTASTTNLYGANLSNCNSSANALTWSGGKFGCNSISTADNTSIFNVRTGFGAKGDGIHRADGAISSGSAIFTSSSGSFGAADIGKVISVYGAGTGGLNLTTTISAVTSSSSITLATTAVTATSSTDYVYGTDDTTAIQNAINATTAAGGGIVYLPAGIYVVNGPFQDVGGANAQLKLPDVLYGAKPQQISIEGEYFQDMNNAGPLNDTGSIIWSTALGTVGGQSVIAAYDATAPYAHFSNILLTVKDLTVFHVMNPQHSILNFKNVDELSMDYVNVDPGINLGGIPQPTGNGSYGIITPDNNNHAFVYLDHVMVYGEYTGIQLNEHGELSRSGIYMTKVAIESPGAGHAKRIDFVSLEDNTTNIKFTGTSQLDAEELDVEHSGISRQFGNGWYNTVNDIEDASNYGTGIIEWAGPESSFSVNGGTGLVVHKIGTTPLASPTFTGSITSQVTGATAAFSAYSPANNFPRATFLIGNSTSDNNAGMYISPSFSSNGSQKTSFIALTTDKTPADTNEKELLMQISTTAALIDTNQYDESAPGTSGPPLEFSTQNSNVPALYISSSSSATVGIGTTNPQAALDVNSTSIIVESSATPASSSAACTTGQIEWDSGFVYVCTATNTWKRAALTTW